MTTHLKLLSFILVVAALNSYACDDGSIYGKGKGYEPKVIKVHTSKLF